MYVLLIDLWCLTLWCLYIKQVLGHGMMLDPPNRSSLWRFDSTAPTNYDDNQNYCGGMNMQWNYFGGKCGVCGDVYNASHPQANENIGTYGQGKVVRQYQAGSVINIDIFLKINHKGNFKYSLCILQNANVWESGEECFRPLALENGSWEYGISETEGIINNRVKLPVGLTCKRCVLRWHYTAGNTWGDCGNRTFATGCGPQETFRSCSDIAIF